MHVVIVLIQQGKGVLLVYFFISFLNAPATLQKMFHFNVTYSFSWQVQAHHRPDITQWLTGRKTPTYLLTWHTPILNLTAVFYYFASVLCAESVHQHIFSDAGLCAGGVHPVATPSADLPFTRRTPSE